MDDQVEDDGLPMFDDDLVVSRVRAGRDRFTVESYAPSLENPYWFKSDSQRSFHLYASYYAKDYSKCLDQAIELLKLDNIRDTSHKEVKDIILRCTLHLPLSSISDSQRSRALGIANEWKDINQPGFCKSASQVFSKFGEHIKALQSIASALQLRGSLPRYMDIANDILTALGANKHNIPDELDSSSRDILIDAFSGTAKGDDETDEIKDVRDL